jgi:hypothetical protein
LPHPPRNDGAARRGAIATNPITAIEAILISSILPPLRKINLPELENLTITDEVMKTSATSDDPALTRRAASRARAGAYAIADQCF